MIDIDELAREAERLGIVLRAEINGISISNPRAPTPVFYTPLISLGLLVSARAAAPALLLPEVPTIIARVLVECFRVGRYSRSTPAVSLSFRKRCTDAILALESMKLLVVSGDEPKRLRVTADGMSHLRVARAQADELGILIRGLDRAFFKVSQREGRA